MLSPSGHLDTFSRDSLPPADQWPEMITDLPELVYPERLNCVQALLDDTIVKYGGERTALIDSAGQQWSYARLSCYVNQLAHVLTEDYKVIAGNRVLLHGANSPMLAAWWLAVVKAGAIAVTTPPLLRSAEIQVITRHAKVQFAICQQDLSDELARSGFSPARTITYTMAPSPADQLPDLAAAKPTHFTAAATAADDVALIAFTSGTSGVPKATMHFHRDVLAIADTFSSHVLKPRPDDIFIGSPPLAFTYGLGGLLIFPLRAGAASVLLDRAAPHDLFRSVSAHRATMLFTAPTAYRASLGRIQDYDLSSLRRCVSAGEALPEWVSHAFYDAAGHRIIDGIGSTEMLHIFISAADDDIQPGATGKPVPGFHARIIDEKGAELPDGTPGLLAVQGPTGCRYLSDERQNNYVQDGWNITGDIYIRDERGYFWYQTRTDDMIVTSGYNVAAPEVEQAVIQHPAVSDCGVVGVPDVTRGMLVKAYVVLASEHAPSEQLATEIKEFAKTKIAPYKHPRLLEFVPELPASSTGKLQRGELRKAAAGQGSDDLF
jgi:2-aminobenzoate-CoA ligase